MLTILPTDVNDYNSDYDSALAAHELQLSQVERALLVLPDAHRAFEIRSAGAAVATDRAMPQRTGKANPADIFTKYVSKEVWRENVVRLYNINVAELRR